MRRESLSADSDCHPSNSSATDLSLDPGVASSGSNGVSVESTCAEKDQELDGAPPDAFREAVDNAADENATNSQEDSQISIKHVTPVSKPSQYSLRKSRRPPDGYT